MSMDLLNIQDINRVEQTNIKGQSQIKAEIPKEIEEFLNGSKIVT